jgi:hypothetical protein
VYLIGDDGSILVYIEGGVVQRRLFAASPDRQHTKSFIDLMNDYPHTPIYMLVDILDQSYVKHALPPVTPLGLNKLVSRRLDRDFAKEDIKGALNLGREKKGRKDWNFLLISISASSGLQGWLDLVLDLPNRFAGIYLVPVECEQILTKLAKIVYNPALSDQNIPVEAASPKRRIQLKSSIKASKEPVAETPRWQLLFSHHKVGGFRQVVLKDGKLIFTRMTQESEGSTAAITAGNIEQEVLNTIEYLKRLSLSETSSLDLFFIVSQEIKAHLSRDRMPCNQAYIFTPHEAAELFQLKQAVLSADRYGDMVIATAFGVSKRHRLKLNPTYAVKLDTLYNGLTALRGSAALIALTCFVYIAISLIAIPTYLFKTQQLRDQEKDKKARYEELNNIDAEFSETAEEVSDMVMLHKMVSEERFDVIKSIAQTANIVTDSHSLSSWEWTIKNLLGDAKDPTMPTESLPAELTITFKTKITYSSNLVKDVTRERNEFYSQIKDVFSDFTLDESSLANTQTNTLKFSLEDTAEKKSSKKTEDLTITLKATKAETTPTDEMLPGAGM